MTLGAREKTLHVLTGFACQNACVFCCDGGFGTFPRRDAAHVREILERNGGLEMVEFTYHEPTLNPDLPRYIAWARELGFRTVSVVTNGRTLARGTLLERLLDAGLTRVRISLHGDRAEVHDRLTQRAGSFDEAVAGIRAVAEARRRRPLALSLHSTLTALNLDRLPQMVPFVAEFSPDQYGLNAVFPPDHPGSDAAAASGEYVVSYSRMVDVLRRCLPEDLPLSVTVSEIPPCQVLGRLPPAHLGIREDFHVAANPSDSLEATSPGRSGFVFGRECPRCAARAICDGVPSGYVDRFGWEEFRPVEQRTMSHLDVGGRARRLLTSAEGRWLLADVRVRGADAYARVVAGTLELDLIVGRRDDRRPAFRRTARHDVIIGANTCGPAHVRLAEQIVAQIARLEVCGAA